MDLVRFAGRVWNLVLAGAGTKHDPSLTHLLLLDMPVEWISLGAHNSWLICLCWLANILLDSPLAGS